MKLQPSFMVLGALAVAAYLITCRAMKFGEQTSAAFNIISNISFESLTSPILSTKNGAPTAMHLFDIAYDSEAITLKVAIVPFWRLMFDSLKSFIFTLMNLATASRVSDSG